MALLNVSDVLDDPDFKSTGVLIRSVVDVSAYGLAQVTSQGTQFEGVFWQGNGTGLVQNGEGDWIEGDLVVVTRFPIDTGRREVASDGIVFAGLPYTITNAQLWAYGDGFTQATGKLATINPSSLPPPSNAGYFS